MKHNNLNVLERKLRKLVRNPKLFLLDSSGLRVARHSWKRTLRLGSFLWVLGCFALAVFYFGLVSTGRFVSEAQLLVKQADQVRTTPDALAMLGLGSNNQQDAQVIMQYLASWPLLEQLDKALALRNHFQQPRIDLISRLSPEASREEFLEYYRDHLSLTLDDSSGIITIRLQAFDPAYARRVVSAMVGESERFINRMGHQVAEEQLRFVEREVGTAHDRVLREQARVLAFQKQHQLLSPEITSAAMQSVVSQLEAELVKEEAELKRLEIYMNPNAPDVVASKDRIAALRQQLTQEQQRLTGDSAQAMNEVNAQYQALQVQAQLAADLYKTGLVSLEQARVEAYRKLKHLLVISQPSQAEEAEYPRRLYNITTAGVLLCLLYGLILMGIATLREHKD